MTQRPDAPSNPPDRRQRGFEQAFGLVQRPVRAVAEARGFPVTRLVTHWAEVAGEDMARITRPVKVGYARKGSDGATLTLLVASAHAPLVQMQLPRLVEKVNAVYGYSAISRIALTQTAPTGFAEGQAEFMPAPQAPAPPDPQVVAKAAETAAPIGDADFRAALEALAQNIFTRRKSKEGTPT